MNAKRESPCMVDRKEDLCGVRSGSFTLQVVILEYVITRLVALASAEILQARLLRLREYSFSQASAREQEAQQGLVQSLKVNPDGSMLASCRDDRVIVFCNMHSDKAFRRLRRDRPYERLTITGIRSLTQAQLASFRALGAVEKEGE